MLVFCHLQCKIIYHIILIPSFHARLVVRTRVRVEVCSPSFVPKVWRSDQSRRTKSYNELLARIPAIPLLETVGTIQIALLPHSVPPTQSPLGKIPTLAIVMQLLWLYDFRLSVSVSLLCLSLRIDGACLPSYSDFLISMSQLFIKSLVRMSIIYSKSNYCPMQLLWLNLYRSGLHFSCVSRL